MIIGISGKIGSGKDTIGSIIQALTTPKVGSQDVSKIFEYINAGFLPVTHAQKSSWEVKRFAGKLKQVISLLTGIPVGDLEKQEVKDYQLGADWIYAETYKDGKIVKVDADYFANDPAFKENPGRFTRHYSVRALLQKVGTEAMRDVIHPNVWVNALFADYVRSRKLVFGIGNLSFSLGYETPYSEEAIGRVEKAGLAAGFTKEGENNYTKDGEFPNWIITDTRFPNEAAAIKARGGIVIRVNRPWEDDYRKRMRAITPNGAYSLPGGGMTGAGGIIEFDIAMKKAVGEHPSETSLDDYKFDYIINNEGTIEELVEKVKYVLQRATII